MTSKIFQTIENIDFNKYCNCYSMPPYGKIQVECYDTVLEAINRHKSRSEDLRVDSRLVIMKKFWPEFMQRILVQTEFTKPVVFLPKLFYNHNVHKTKDINE